MINKRGQTLITFIIFIPIIIVIIAILVDNGLIIKEKNKLQSITEMIAKEINISNSKEETEKQIKVLYEENKISTENLKIEISDTTLEIEIKCRIESIFGNLIGKKEYEIKGYIYSSYDVIKE